jgi:cell wall-associated NlpC family hydrolase
VSHWAAGYVGTPWVAGESDCWSLARRIWRERFGWDVPPLAVDAASALDTRRAGAAASSFIGWIEVADPREGDAVLMAMGRHPCHVGIYVDGGRVLHAVEGAGAVCTPLGRLRDMGYRAVGYWRHAG